MSTDVTEIVNLTDETKADTPALNETEKEKLRSQYDEKEKKLREVYSPKAKPKFPWREYGSTLHGYILSRCL